MPDHDLIETPLLELPEEEQVKVWQGRCKLAAKYLKDNGNQTT